MISAARAQEVLLAMPLVQEKLNPGYPDFRVNGKLFAKLWHGAGFANLKVGPEEQIMLSSQSKTFSIPKGIDSNGWISVKLGLIDEEEFLDLVWKAWRRAAGPRLALQY